MRSFCAFVGKELTEQLRTFKGLVMLAVLLLFGMTSPLFAKLTPEILKMAGGGSSGVKIELPPPTVIDAYAQFFKNVGQIALIVVILIFAGAVAAETSRGTAALMLTRRLSRPGFILAKFTAAALVWAVSYSAGAAVCVAYTRLLFPVAPPPHLILSLACMGLYGLIVLAAALLCSTVFSNFALAAVGGFVCFALLAVPGAFPRIKDGAPSALGSGNVPLLSGSLSAAAMRLPAVTGLLLLGLLLLAACLIFRRREL